MFDGRRSKGCGGRREEEKERRINETRRTQMAPGKAGIAKDVLDVLAAGIERLRNNGGRFCSEGVDKSDATFWLNGKQRFIEDATNLDVAIAEYQSTVKQFRCAYDGLIAMSRSILFEMAKLDAKMRPILLGRGIEKLPDELLEKVLLLAIDEELRTRKLMRLVCKRFSNIIKHQPTFWNRLTSRMEPTAITNRLERLGNMGLTVYLDDDCDYYDDIQDAVEALVPLADRWETVHANFNNRTHMDLEVVYDALKNLRLPALRSLMLECDEGLLIEREGATGGEDPIYTTWKAPRLDSIISENVIPDPIPEMRLTYCSISLCTDCLYFWDFEALSAFFYGARTLETLEIEFRSAAGVDYDKLPKVALPQLRSLSVSLDPGDRFNAQFLKPGGDDDRSDPYALVFQLIDSLQTPRLEHLAVTLDSSPGQRGDFFICGIVRSREHSPMLRRVEVAVENSSFYTELITATLAQLKHLEHLVLYGPGLLRGRDYRRLPPRHPLRKLHLKQCSGFTSDDVEYLLNKFTDPSLFPNFEELVIERCANLTTRDLAGIKGVERVVWQD